MQRKTTIPNLNKIKVSKPAVSLMIHTASMDHFLQSKGINSYFESLIFNLSHQRFKNFELIYIDTFYENNKEKFHELTRNLSFRVKHVEIHKDHRYWYDKGHTYISAAKNTGILYSDGELLVTCDDAEFFHEDLLRCYWDEYKKGCYMLGLHKRLKSIKTQDGKIIMPISGDEYINDSRFEYLEGSEYKVHNTGTLAFAGSSFSLKDALLLNGFNEKMDACKSLEDCDFGIRLSLIGKKFSLYKQGFLYILEHPSYSDDIISLYSPENCETKKKISNFIAIENYSMVVCAQKLMDIKANKGPITNKHIEIIKQETLKYRGFDPTDNDHINDFNIWLSCPNFNLEQERKDLRNSEKWIWK